MRDDFGKHISSGFDCLLSSRGTFFTVRIFNILMYACNLVIDVKLIVRKDGEEANSRDYTTMMRAEGVFKITKLKKGKFQ